MPEPDPARIAAFASPAELNRWLKANHASDNPLLIRIESRVGHAAGAPITKLVEKYADLWAFLWEHVGRPK